MLRFTEGFETNRSATRYARKYSVVAGSQSAAVTGRKIGSAVPSATLQLTTKALVSAVENTWVLGFGLFVTTISGTGANQPFFEFRDGTGEQCNIRLIPSTDTTGNFMVEMRRGSTVLGTSASLPANRWLYVEFKATVRTSTNGAYEIRVDGTNVLSDTGVNTASQGTDGADRVRLAWGATTGTNITLDDIYILDDTGGSRDDFLGPSIVHGTLPDANGNRTQWSPSTGSSNFVLVDESAVTDSDADYNSSEIAGNVDLYGFAAVSTMATGGTPTVHGVQVNVMAAMLSSGSRSFSVIFRDTGTTEANGSNHTLSSTSLDILATIFQVNPATTTAWTKAAIDAGEFGVEDAG